MMDELVTLMVADLLQAIKKDRKPAFRAADGRWTIAMMSSLYLGKCKSSAQMGQSNLGTDDRKGCPPGAPTPAHSSRDRTAGGSGPGPVVLT